VLGRLPAALRLLADWSSGVFLRYNGEEKEEEAMPKRSTSQHVPKEMQARFEEITHLTDAFCRLYLNEEYAQLCRELTATLCRKRLSPLVQGKAPTWACGIIHALGMVNFLFDSSQTPILRPARSGSISR
jgi:hypothetical protein